MLDLSEKFLQLSEILGDRFQNYLKINLKITVIIILIQVHGH